MTLSRSQWWNQEHDDRRKGRGSNEATYVQEVKMKGKRERPTSPGWEA